MAFEYLKVLSLTDEQEAKLRGLAARSASALLSLIEHNPEKFQRFFGEEETRRIQGLLPSMVSEEEKTELSQLPAFRGKFGALIVSDPPSDAEQAARQRQKELMNRIKMIRESGSSSAGAKTKLESLENELRQTLKSTVSSGD